MKRWCCKECGHVHPGINPPMRCPDCGANEESMIYRPLKKEDYTKIRQSKKKMPNRADVLVLGSGVAAFTAAVIAAYYGASVIMIEASSAIGGRDQTGFSPQEKAAAYKSVQKWEKTGGMGNDEDSTYRQAATDMLEFLANEELLPEFAEAKRNPEGALHPWQSFAESTLLEEGTQPAPETKRTLLHQLAHWATDNAVRMLINHEIVRFEVNDDNEISGVEVLFNEKSRTYHGDMGVVSFLGEDDKRLLTNGDESHKPEDLTNFYQIGYIPEIAAEKAELEFWGKGCSIGPAMTAAYQSGVALVRESGLMDDREQTEELTEPEE